jgi:hypothetical protein
MKKYDYSITLSRAKAGRYKVSNQVLFELVILLRRRLPPPRHFWSKGLNGANGRVSSPAEDD